MLKKADRVADLARSRDWLYRLYSYGQTTFGRPLPEPDAPERGDEMPPRPEFMTHSSPATADGRFCNFVRTFCGRTIRGTENAGNFPSCPKCANAIADREAMEIG